MNQKNTTLGTATITNSNFNPIYCHYRLPCGYCEKLGRNCPKSSDNKVFYTNTTALDSIYINNLDKEEK